MDADKLFKKNEKVIKTYRNYKTDYNVQPI